MSAIIDPSVLNETQTKAYHLIQNDFGFIYSLYYYLPDNAMNYYTQFMPYFATIVDGAEDWLSSVKKSSKLELPGREFDSNEEAFYASVRAGIKFWGSSYQSNYELLEYYYQSHQSYFDSIATKTARLLHLVDYYGVFSSNAAFCGNTLLADVYIPLFDLLRDGNGDYLSEMSAFAGKYTVLFDAKKPFPLKQDKQFYDYDFGGLRKSPVGKPFSDKYVLMTLLCQINFILYCVINYFEDAMSSEIRFAYLLYYYICGSLSSINEANNNTFTLNSKHYSDLFRDSVAHYKVGVSLKPEELIDDDPLFGLTQKYLGINSAELKSFLVESLSQLSEQLTAYLEIKPLDPVWCI